MTGAAARRAGSKARGASRPPTFGGRRGKRERHIQDADSDGCSWPMQRAGSKDQVAHRRPLDASVSGGAFPALPRAARSSGWLHSARDGDDVGNVRRPPGVSALTATCFGGQVGRGEKALTGSVISSPGASTTLVVAADSAPSGPTTATEISATRPPVAFVRVSHSASISTRKPGFRTLAAGRAAIGVGAGEGTSAGGAAHEDGVGERGKGRCREEEDTRAVGGRGAWLRASAASAKRSRAMLMPARATGRPLGAGAADRGAAPTAWCR